MSSLFLIITFGQPNMAPNYNMYILVGILLLNLKLLSTTRCDQKGLGIVLLT